MHTRPDRVMEDGSLRTGDESADDQKSPWYRIAGDSYIAEAFRYAHDADPDAKLFYNDYYDYLPAKHDGIYNLLRGLLAAGVPVHGVGMQCHFNIAPSTDMTHQSYYQSVENLEAAIKLKTTTPATSRRRRSQRSPTSEPPRASPPSGRV